MPLTLPTLYTFFFLFFSGSLWSSDQKSILLWFQDNPEQVENFPFRTVIMLINFGVTLLTSIITNWFFITFPQCQANDFLGHELIDISEENRDNDAYKKSSQYRKLTIYWNFSLILITFFKFILATFSFGNWKTSRITQIEPDA